MAQLVRLSTFTISAVLSLQTILPETRKAAIPFALFFEFTLFLCFFNFVFSWLDVGYYVGRPMNHDEQKTQPPPPSQAVDEQVNAQVPGTGVTDPSVSLPDSFPRTVSFSLLEPGSVFARTGYYAGRVQGKKNAAGDQSSAAADQTPKESGFLASW